MEYAIGLTRTSMALDQGTLTALRTLSQKWKVSKAEVMRRAVRNLNDETEREQNRQTPLEALAWLQTGGGIDEVQATRLREELDAERQARRGWWE